MNARSLRESSFMRVLSPSTEPPVIALDGSTASTATRWPSSIRRKPSASISVDLPTPGEPVMPMRSALARARQQLRHDLARECLVIGSGGLGERDGFGKQPPVGGAHARDEPLSFAQALVATVRAARIFDSTSAAHTGIAVPGP